MNAIAKTEDRAPSNVIAASSMLEVISRAASDPNTDVTKLERLMAMAERMEAKRAELAFDDAMSTAQAGMEHVRTDAANKATSSRYATYGALDRAIRPIYTSNGFSISFDTGDAPLAGDLRVLAYVAHKGGHKKTYKIDMPADGKGAKGGDVMTRTHATGSAFTYGKRYSLGGIFNIVVSDADDDGNSAGSSAAAGAPITPEQLAELNGMLSMCKGDPELFCQYMKVPAMVDIRQRDIGKAREALNNAINEYQRKNGQKAKGHAK